MWQCLHSGSNVYWTLAARQEIQQWAKYTESLSSWSASFHAVRPIIKHVNNVSLWKTVTIKWRKESKEKSKGREVRVADWEASHDAVRDLSEKRVSEQGPKGREAASLVATWAERVLDVRKRKHGYPARRACLACSESSREASMAGVRWVKGTDRRWGQRNSWARSHWTFMGHYNSFVCYSKVENYWKIQNRGARWI